MGIVAREIKLIMELVLGTWAAEMWKVPVRCIYHSHLHLHNAQQSSYSASLKEKKIVKNEAVHILQVYFPPLLTIKDLCNSQMPEATYSRDELPNWWSAKPKETVEISDYWNMTFFFFSY